MHERIYEIELEPPQMDDPCECCGDRPVRLTRFVKKDGAAYGVYYALYSNKSAERGAHVLLSLGPWWPGSRPEERSCFYFQIWPEEESSSLRLDDAAGSPWRAIDRMGAPLSRDEALRHPLRREVFALHDEIADADTSIRGFLDRSRSGDTSEPLEVRYGLPDPVFVLPEEERSVRANLGGDFVSLDASRFFVRTLLPLPIEDRSSWDVATWCEISPPDFETLHEVWNAPDDYARFSCPGTVANDCTDIEAAGYFGAAVEIGVRDREQLPVIQSSDHTSLSARIREPWSWPDFLQFAVNRGFL